MLFILTGAIQIGKTRWLQQTLHELENHGVLSYGVIAPGTWIEHDEGQGISYEKTGINNELLPQHTIVPFARRNDLVDDHDTKEHCTQSQRAQLAWAIDDDAIERVNAHLNAIAQADIPKPGLLVVDELGRLELLAGEGLTSALQLIDRGPTQQLPHALIVVREQLLDQARKRFEASGWGETRPIAPSKDAICELLAAFQQ